jgi:hypothetical protein
LLIILWMWDDCQDRIRRTEVTSISFWSLALDKGTVDFEVCIAILEDQLARWRLSNRHVTIWLDDG